MRDIRRVKNGGGGRWFKRFPLLYFARVKRDREREMEREFFEPVACYTV
jgi:hypothetical protein